MYLFSMIPATAIFLASLLLTITFIIESKRGDFFKPILAIIGLLASNFLALVTIATFLEKILKK